VNIRSFDKDKDYNDVSSWWTKQNWPVIPIEFLGPNGFMIENEQNKIATMWVLQFGGTPMYSIEWIIGNPDIEWQDRSEGIKQLTNYLCDWTKKQDGKIMLCMTQHKRIADNFLKIGFTTDDTHIYPLIRSL